MAPSLELLLDFQASTHSVEKGDVLCLIHGSRVPTLIRVDSQQPSKSYPIISITVSSLVENELDSVGSSLLEHTTEFPHESSTPSAISNPANGTSKLRGSRNRCAVIDVYRTVKNS